MKNLFRDKARDNLTVSLNVIGVQAAISGRGRSEEKIENSWYQRSLGIIDIAEGPVRWINVLKKDRGKHDPPKWWLVLCIPDENLVAFHHGIKIKTVRRKTFPLFGKIIDVTWKGQDGGTGLVDKLSSDVAIKVLAKRIGNLEIKHQADEFQGWTLTIDRKFVPSSEDWQTIRRIARLIISS